MIPSLTFHHIGLATKNMDRAKGLYLALGYAVSDSTVAASQRVRVCFVTKDGHPTIELIEPLSDDSPVRTILEKSGSTPYHLCYTTPDLAKVETQLRALKCQPVGDVFRSEPLNGQATRFFYSSHIGLFEVAERTEQR
jgi:methylmalonyl-CoA/ethylmalonyl-CoA epimerase